MNRFYLPVLLIFLFAGLARGQTKKAFMLAAEEAYLASDFHSSLSYYLEAYEFDSTDIEINHAVAEAARKFDAYALAEKHY